MLRNPPATGSDEVRDVHAFIKSMNRFRATCGERQLPDASLNLDFEEEDIDITMDKYTENI